MSKFLKNSMEKEVERLMLKLLSESANQEEVREVLAASSSLVRVLAAGVEDRPVEPYQHLVRISAIAEWSLKGLKEFKPTYGDSMDKSDQEYFEKTLSWFADRGGDYKKLCFLVGRRSA